MASSLVHVAVEKAQLEGVVKCQPDVLGLLVAMLERLGPLARARLRAVPVAHHQLVASSLRLAEHREQLRHLRVARRAEEPRVAKDDLGRL